MPESQKNTVQKIMDLLFLYVSKSKDKTES